MMSRVRATGNRAEALLRRELWARGCRYRCYNRALIGRPDIVFISARVVVFVDGDFWHARGIIDNGVRAFKKTLRTSRRDWWLAKLSRTIERDRDVTAALRQAGWRVIRVWESDVLRSPASSAARIAGIVRRRQALDA
jgi:DNA mismatch endonuclease (patch repair protein)